VASEVWEMSKHVSNKDKMACSLFLLIALLFAPVRVTVELELVV
jgi:hypothetical protein